jgi:outer membrane protein TolC
LQNAEGLALKNHPQVLAAQDVISAANERVREARAAYYPDFSGDITGSQGNPKGASEPVT